MRAHRGPPGTDPVTTTLLGRLSPRQHEILELLPKGLTNQDIGSALAMSPETLMKVNRDFRDLFAALNDAQAEYLLVGGYAVAFHAQPRFTKDLDVWANPTSINAERVLAALRAFGAPLHGLTATELARPGLIFQIGVPPNRIDVLTAIDGVDFAEAWAAREQTTYADQAVPVIGRADLIRNKRAAGRPQDLTDADALERRG